MTVQSRIYTVALDASNNPKPLDLAGAAVGFVTTRWIVISNLTPYVMQLNGIRDQPESQAVLAPGTANKFAWSNQYGDLTATWTNPIAGAPPSTPQVIAEYSDDPNGHDIVGSYPCTLQSGVIIGSITGPVTISGTVAVSSVGGTVTVGGTVNATVTNTVTITPSGTINVQGVAGGTAIGIAGTVTISSGTVNIGTVSGTVTVAGTVNANITNASIAVTGSVNANITNASIAVTGSVSISGTPTVTISSGSVNIGTVTGPVSVENVTNTALATQYYTDSLTVTGPSGSNPYSYTASAVARPYKQVIVTVLASSRPLCVSVSNGLMVTCSAFWELPGSGGATSTHQAIVPCFNNGGDNLIFEIYMSSAVAPTAIQIHGTTDGPAPLVRSDGRCYPIGTHNATAALVAATGPTTIISAPAGQLRILIKSLNMTTSTVGNFINVTGTVAGSGLQLVQLLTGALVWDPQQGQLLDQNTALTIGASSSSTAAVQVQYDLVV